VSLAAILRLCLRDPTFSRFETIPACNGWTDGETDGHTTTANTAPAWRRAVKMRQQVTMTEMHGLYAKRGKEHCSKYFRIKRVCLAPFIFYKLSKKEEDASQRHA